MSAKKKKGRRKRRSFVAEITFPATCEGCGATIKADDPYEMGCSHCGDLYCARCVAEDGR